MIQVLVDLSLAEEAHPGYNIFIGDSKNKFESIMTKLIAKIKQEIEYLEKQTKKLFDKIRPSIGVDRQNSLIKEITKESVLNDEFDNLVTHLDKLTRSELRDTNAAHALAQMSSVKIVFAEFLPQGIPVRITRLALTERALARSQARWNSSVLFNENPPDSAEAQQAMAELGAQLPFKNRDEYANHNKECTRVYGRLDHLIAHRGTRFEDLLRSLSEGAMPAAQRSA
jgi:hypothetical protein